MLQKIKAIANDRLVNRIALADLIEDMEKEHLFDDSQVNQTTPLLSDSTIEYPKLEEKYSIENEKDFMSILKYEFEHISGEYLKLANNSKVTAAYRGQSGPEVQ